MIVLDTHVWLWWTAQPDRLSQTARRAIEAAERIGVSTLSAWEVAMLTVRRRIELDRDVDIWVGQALARPRVEPLPPTASIAVAAGLLDASAFPGDPIDRLIYATALATRGTLVTRDRAIRDYDPRTTVW